MREKIKVHTRISASLKSRTLPINHARNKEAHISFIVVVVCLFLFCDCFNFGSSVSLFSNFSLSLHFLKKKKINRMPKRKQSSSKPKRKESSSKPPIYGPLLYFEGFVSGSSRDVYYPYPSNTELLNEVDIHGESWGLHSISYPSKTFDHNGLTRGRRFFLPDNGTHPTYGGFTKRDSFSFENKKNHEVVVDWGKMVTKMEELLLTAFFIDHLVNLVIMYTAPLSVFLFEEPPKRMTWNSTWNIANNRWFLGPNPIKDQCEIIAQDTNKVLAFYKHFRSMGYHDHISDFLLKSGLGTFVPCVLNDSHEELILKLIPSGLTRCEGQDWVQKHCSLNLFL